MNEEQPVNRGNNGGNNGHDRNGELNRGGEGENNNPPIMRMRDYSRPNIEGYSSCIVLPNEGNNLFQVKAFMIQMLQVDVQFSGDQNEDPNSHIQDFVTICNTFRTNMGASDEMIRLKLFHYSLRDKARTWFKNLQPGSINSWEKMASAFLMKYFPPRQAIKLRNEVSRFSQVEDESLAEAWERYKGLLRRVPNHGIPMWMQVQNFYNGIANTYKMQIESVANGNPEDLEPQEFYDLIDRVVNTSYSWHSVRSDAKKPMDYHGAEAVSKLTSQMEQLAQQIIKMNTSPTHHEAIPNPCDFRGGPHPNTINPEVKMGEHAHEQCHFVGRNPINPQNHYSDLCNSGPGNHPNSSWLPQPGQQEEQAFEQESRGYYQEQPPQQYKQPVQAKEEKEPDFKMLVAQFMKQTQSSMKSLETHVHQFTASTQSSIKSLETQVHQLAASSSNSKGKWALPSNIEPNPRENVMAITLRCGKEISDPNEIKKLISVAGTSKKAEANKEQAVPVTEKPSVKAKEPVLVQEEPVEKYIPPSPYQPPAPYPGALVGEKLEKRHSKILDTLRKLHINLPFLEALNQMPDYKKFLKDILSNKTKLKNVSCVQLNRDCSSILLNRLPLPRKMKDPGSFSIPCSIGNLHVENALCDLGASINLIPYSLYTKLGIGEPQPTRMSIQLADRSICYPRGIVEDVLVKVGKFILPADFVVMDMPEDMHVPIILGRPFLATGGALIDVKAKELSFRVNGDTIIFEMNEGLVRRPTSNDACYFLDSPLQSSVLQETKHDVLEKIWEEEVKICEGTGCSKETTEKSPLPPNTSDPSLKKPPDIPNGRISKPKLDMKEDVGVQREVQVNEMEECRLFAYENAQKCKEKPKLCHGKKTKVSRFYEGQQVLLHDSRMKLFPVEVKSRWSGPFVVNKLFTHGKVEIVRPGGEPFKVNGKKLEPCSAHEFPRVIDTAHFHDPP
ncbi:hypothetical protein M5689_002140 [Euphorbia peplus]|nr:hypothetical protein M5689_002140 [Euphorbia peplus]